MTYLARNTVKENYLGFRFPYETAAHIYSVCIKQTEVAIFPLVPFSIYIYAAVSIYIYIYIYTAISVCLLQTENGNSKLVESLQSHFILTMSHWSSGLPIYGKKIREIKMFIYKYDAHTKRPLLETSHSQKVPLSKRPITKRPTH